MRASSPAKYTALADTNVYDHVNLLLSFRDRTDREAFDTFSATSTKKFLSVIVYLIAGYYFSYASFDAYFKYPSVLSSVFVVLVIVLQILLNLVLMLFKIWEICGRDIPSIVKSGLRSAESLWLLSMAVCISLLIVQIGYSGPCHRVADYGCNYYRVEGRMPDDILLAAITMPIFLAKGATWMYALSAYFIILFCILFTVLYFNLKIWWFQFILYSACALVVLYEHQRQLIAQFLLTKSKDRLLAELEAYGEEMNAKELRSMIANVAHDLKTPMAAIVNGLDYCSSTLTELLKESGDPKKVLAGAKALIESVTNMKNVNQFMIMSINRCIDYSKASNGVVLLPHEETVKLSDLLFLPINCMRNLMEGKIGFELQPISADIATHIITDKQWLQENVLCLLSNAGKYSSEGTVKISLRLCTSSDFPAKSVSTCGEATMLLCAEVEDSGIGISDDMKATLFSPFKQAQRLAGGTGLGLYSLAKRVEALKGYYGVRNRSDGRQGSCFWFAIPYRPDDVVASRAYLPANASSHDEDSRGLGIDLNVATLPNTANPSPRSYDAPATPVSTSSKYVGLRILLVDDSMSILKITGMMLRKLGHTVTTAENGAIALKKLGLDGSKAVDELPDFDCVLMDLQMPVMDGLEATKRIRAAEKQTTGGHQLIMGVSACSDSETIQAALASGIDVFISKPFSKESFNESYQRCKAAVGGKSEV